MAASSFRLNQAVGASGAPRTYFFNGRLLAAEDLQREQALREAGQGQLARLIGCGIAGGLEVTGATGSASLSIAPGLGVTPTGEVIDVEALTLDLSSAAEARRPGGFATCAAAMANLEAPTAGIYLLTLAATWIGSGRAATLLGEVGACNRALELPAVLARLHKIAVPQEADADTARNLIASALLVPDDVEAPITHAPAAEAPAGALRLVGWLPASRVPTLSAAELPLAVLQIDADAKVIWLDSHAPRRRLAPPPGLAGDDFWRTSHKVEMEAFASQFVAQAKAGAKAGQFVHLPPVASLTLGELNSLAALFAKDSIGSKLSKAKATIVGRADFASALHDGLEDATVTVKNAVLSVLRLRGSERYLLRFQHRDYRSGLIGAIESERNERSSKKLASLAGKTLKDENADPAKRSLAASVLTQAPDKPRRRNPGKRPPTG